MELPLNTKIKKTFINLCFHEADFGVPAEWHFSATSHGKGACDGVGGTVKRQAVRASLQRPYEEQIMTPCQLFEWAVENIPTVAFNYCSSEDYNSEEQLLEERFQQSRTIPGARKLHSFVPLTKATISTKVYSLSAASKVERVSVLESELAFDDISSFVVCVYEKEWWVACVLQLDEDKSAVKVNFLHPQGPSRSFRFPSTPDILTVPIESILIKIDPKCTRRGTYTLSRKESRSAGEKLRQKLTEV